MSARLRVGMEVQHPEYGCGVIEYIHEHPGGDSIWIQFITSGVIFHYQTDVGSVNHYRHRAARKGE